MRLTDLLRGTVPQPRRRPRRGPARPDGPRTIIPVSAPEPAAPAPESAAGDPFEVRVDAARERLRRAIPPVIDEE